MVRRILLAALLLMSVSSGFSQLRSPEAFLGYPLGSRYTPHWKIADYFRHLAASSSTIKLESYGTTPEGRPLLLAFIASPENINRLESIRQNNLRLAGLSNDKAAPVEENAPVIVWLSYNVHGNEPSSSEAAMLTAYNLVDPTSATGKEWLKNTVVVIDPCINPDGRDRYVNWYNSVVGATPNPNLDAREHDEPWPGGRTNHYNFDLNRDWAWQVQRESQLRVKMYRQWMPQVHVDYHEQGVDDPYYFAPAAPSYHDVITPWQRSFQVTMGKNHATYFDRNHWLYFTKEIFDLFYPSYGDTYPMFNGAIGMTYEQAGGPAGGLMARKKEGDTLTLADRIQHHFTTGMSTIEVASKNAGRVIREFRNYFSNAIQQGVGTYKSYIVRAGKEDAQRMRSFLDVLDKNGIRYSAAASGVAKGYHYINGKEESVNVSANDVLVSTYQPNGALAEALLEPVSRLEDSVTYDITAWSLPYVHGLDAWALRDNWRSGGAWTTENAAQADRAGYGYVIRWEGLQSVRVLTRLEKQGVLLRYAQEPFEIGGKQFNRGSILVLKNANGKFGDRLWDMVLAACREENIVPESIATGFADKGYDFGSSKVHSLKPPRIVLATGEGVDPSAAGDAWHFFEQQVQYPVTLVNAASLPWINWNEVDVLVLPDGNGYSFLNDKTNFEKFKDWINRGGRVIAFRKAIAQLAKTDIGIKLKKADEAGKPSDSSYADLKIYGNRERLAASNEVPGAMIKIDLDNTHPLAFGYPSFCYALKLDDRIYEFIHEDGWNVGVLKKNNQVNGYIGAGKKNVFRDGLLFGVQEMGAGTITYLAADILYRGFWENGKLMFANAVFLVGQ